MNCLILLLLLFCCGGNNFGGNNCGNDCRDNNCDCDDSRGRRGETFGCDDSRILGTVEDNSDLVGWTDDCTCEDMSPIKQEHRHAPKPYPNISRAETCGCEKN